MPSIGLTPDSPVAAEDIRNLKRRPRHGPRRLSLGIILLLLHQAEPVQRAHHLADRGGGHPRVKRGGVELGMAEQPRVIMLSFYVIGIESFAGRDWLLADAAEHFVRNRRQCPPP